MANITKRANKRCADYLGGEVAEVAGRKNLGKRLIFAFADGSRAEVDVGPAQPLDHLVGLLPGPA